jgi:hypothetical protein
MKLASWCAAALALVWGVRAMTSAKSTSFTPDLLFYGAAVVVLCSLTLSVLVLLEPWMRPQDAAWVQQQNSRWRVPALVAVVVALVLCVDLAASVWGREPALREVEVVRSTCSRSSSGSVRATIRSATANGQWCFEAASVKRGSVPLWRVDIDRVQPPRDLRATGVLKLRMHPSWIFGAEAYTVVQGVV